MASNNLIFFLLPSLALLQMVSAVEYTITGNAGGTPGGVRFNNEIGAIYSRQTLEAATNFIWNIFRQSTAADRKNVQTVTLFIDRDYNGVAFADNNQIHISASYIAGYGGDLKREITGILYHEMTHVWQWNGNPSAPGWVIEGIADYVRLKSGYIPGHWVRPGGGRSWEEGYDKTARFFEYLDGRRSGFVAELNRRLRTGYSPDYFVQLLGKPVNQLWAEYKAAFGNPK
ncbi:uncharacterized protein LOC111017306 [Momordica charantia]|uniref:Uncharacterized protein LOC111017306 n=1 Tax=Momordica charantia TaxID=3673 RepID=A0A6J1D681_MOMCH|nr:uncharacterized protein LOC111017306 [Momordica charantia]